jgi:hypothetical protein
MLRTRPAVPLLQAPMTETAAAAATGGGANTGSSANAAASGGGVSVTVMGPLLVRGADGLLRTNFNEGVLRLFREVRHSLDPYVL